MCPAPSMVANVNGPALRVTPALLPSTFQSRSGCATNSSCPVHSSPSVIFSLPTCQRSRSARNARRGRTETHPVADPVVRTDVDEHADTPLEKRAEVELRREHHVHRCVEAHADVLVAGGEVCGEQRVDANRLPDVRAVEEGIDFPMKAWVSDRAAI